MKQKEIKIDVVKLALAIQLAVFGLIGLNKIEIDIVRQVVVFFYLAFLPGILILKILNIKTSLTKTMLLSVGTSLSFVTLFTGLANFLLPYLGAERPISEVPLAIFLCASTLLLIGVCKWRGSTSISFHLPKSLPPPNILFFLILPFLSLIGVHILCINWSNTLLLLLLAIISVIPLLVSLNKIHRDFYPLIIWLISISLLLYANLAFVKSLGENEIAGVVQTAGIWDPFFPQGHSSLMTISLIHPVFSIFMGIDIIWEVRIIGCLVASLIPLAMYELHTEFFDHETSFLSSCLYVFFLPFCSLVANTRSGFAILFMCLFMLLVFSDEINLEKRKFLSIIFAFSIITSHYGTAYLFMLVLISIFMIFLARRYFTKEEKFFVTLNLCILYFVLVISWYLYTSGSLNFDVWIVNFSKHVLTHISEFFRPESSATMEALATEYPSLSIRVTKYLMLATVSFIFVGVLKLFYHRIKEKTNFNDEYTFFVIAFVLILLTMLLPGFTGAFRTFSVSAVLTAPLAVVGFSEIFKRLHLGLDHKKCLVAFSLFLTIFLSFKAGLVSNAINTISGEVIDFSLDGHEEYRIQKSDNLEAKCFLYYNDYSDPSLASIEWLLRHKNSNETYMDTPMSLTLPPQGKILPFLSAKYGGRVVYEDMTSPKRVSIKNILKEKKMKRGGYILLGYYNIAEDVIIVKDENDNRQSLKTSDYINLFRSKNKVYDSGANIYYIGDKT